MAPQLATAAATAAAAAAAPAAGGGFITQLATAGATADGADADDATVALLSADCAHFSVDAIATGPPDVK
jgi:hypothetical protein